MYAKRWCWAAQVVACALAVVRLGGALVAALGSAAGASACQQWWTDLDPRSYTSPSGVYRLEIDPGTRDGGGEGAYRFTRGGQEVWSARHAFTLWEAAVTNDGVTIGYAQTDRWQDESCKYGFFHVVAISADGKLLLHEVTARTCYSTLQVATYPVAVGMFVDPDNDRFVIRLSDKADPGGRAGPWWVYRLSTLQRLADLNPSREVNKATSTWCELDARPVPGTPLTLVHWYAGNVQPGARFALVDLAGRPVWTRKRAGDYTRAGDHWADLNLQRYIRAHGAILRCDEPRRFELWFVAEGKRVAFEVTPASGGAPAWDVRELSRHDHVWPAVVDRAAPPLESVSLDHVGAITLGSEPAQQPAIRRVLSFDLESRGRAGFVRAESVGAWTFVLVGPTGEVLGEVPSSQFAGAGRGSPVVTWLAGERWAVIERLERTFTRAWTVDSGGARVEPLTLPGVRGVEAVAGTPDGGVVALVSGVKEDAVLLSLAAFDGAGKHRWTVGPGLLGDPHDVTVTTGGSAALLDVAMSSAVHLFDSHGYSMHTVRLEQPEGLSHGAFHAPRSAFAYDTATIEAEPDGGLLVHDPRRWPPVWRLDADGIVRAKVSLRYPDGRRLATWRGVRAGPDGRLWATDGDALLRFTDEGVVDHVLGAPLHADDLGDIAALTIDQHGRIYALSQRTAVVHVFDGDGKLLHRCEPLPEDIPIAPPCLRMVIADNGSVFVDDESGHWVQFCATGERMGIANVSGRPTWGDWQPKPSGQGSWAVGNHELLLLGPDRQVLRTIQRRPDGCWLGHVLQIAVAPSGAVAAFTDRAISLYGPEGDGIRTLELPPGTLVGKLSYNGRWLALGRRSDVLILDTEGAATWRIAGTESDCGACCCEPVLTADGRELWLWKSGGRTLHGYRLP